MVDAISGATCPGGDGLALAHCAESVDSQKSADLWPISVNAEKKALLWSFLHQRNDSMGHWR